MKSEQHRQVVERQLLNFTWWNGNFGSGTPNTCCEMPFRLNLTTGFTVPLGSCAIFRFATTRSSNASPSPSVSILAPSELGKHNDSTASGSRETTFELRHQLMLAAAAVAALLRRASLQLCFHTSLVTY